MTNTTAHRPKNIQGDRRFHNYETEYASRLPFVRRKVTIIF